MFNKRILPVMVFMLLLIGLAYFPYLPMLFLKLFNVDYNGFSMTMKAIYMFLCDLGYIGVLFLIYKDKIINDFKKYFKKFGENFELSFKYYFVGVIIMIASNLIITLLFKDAQAGNEEAVRSLIDQLPLYMIFSVSLYAPITEELIFRHSIKDCIVKDRKNKTAKLIYIISSGFIFAAMHILGQTSSNLDYIYLIPYMSLGVAFAALYSKTDNIFASIMMHALHNTVTVILYFMAGGII